MDLEDHFQNAVKLHTSKTGQSACTAEFLIVKSPDNLVSGFDITKVTLTGDNNQTICSDTFKVNDTWLSKDHLHNDVKLHASKTCWSECTPFQLGIKCK